MKIASTKWSFLRIHVQDDGKLVLILEIEKSG